MTLTELVRHLNELGGHGDTASVMINNEGRCYLGVGMNDYPMMNVEELTQYLEGRRS